jgi:hypothetical protein
MSGGTRNSSRPSGCNAAALVMDEGCLLQAIRIGDRATRRTAARTLKKLKAIHAAPAKQGAAS